ncbi:hypothetical protein RchiOBHm_Chr5g0079721 [Rosa chinensis]|uniref:Uncharacterized protein n=1 Tax=Rosa chinensis TaxID=74649 RepID=A0A2P6QML0_ROSCH|nr:hypothetical protein RchiOBHm_Chr5g0079721 [Rosa chinensis]
MLAFFSVGMNLLSGLGAKIERESKLKLNDFDKVRSFNIVDLSGFCNVRNSSGTFSRCRCLLLFLEAFWILW